MDSEMVMEVPDTPERAAFNRSVGESFSRTFGIDDKPLSSNQYFEPMTRTYSRQMKNSGPHGFNGNGVTPVDDDFLFSQARIARSMSDIPGARKTHLINSSSKPREFSVLNDNGTKPKTIDLCQESPIRYRTSRNKEEKQLSLQRERNQITGSARIVIRSSASMEGLGKERNNAGNSLEDFVSSSNTNEAENLICRSSAVSSGKEKLIIQQLNSRTTNEQLQSSHSELGFLQKDLQQKKLPNCCISSCDLANSNKNGQAEPYCQGHGYSDNHGTSSSPVVKNLDIEIGDGPSKVSECIRRRADLRPQGLVLHPGNTGHRRLVRNGFISPSNIARNKNDEKAKGIYEVSVISSKIPNTNSSQSRYHSSSEGRTVDKGKGKELMNDEFLASSQIAKPPYRRSYLKEVMIISDMDHDTDWAQIDGSEATHKQLEKMSRPLSSSSEIGGSKYDPSVGIKTEEASSQSGQNITRLEGCFKLDSEAPQLTGKRKINFTHPNAGGCSSSTVDSPRISYDRTSLKPPSYKRSTRSRKSVRVDTGLAPIVEIDELDGNTHEENHELSDEFIARSLQLESDEVLARRLQEQFYLESPPVGAIEREGLLPALVGRPRFYHSSTRLTARARTDNRTGRIRRNISRPSMNLEEGVLYNVCYAVLRVKLITILSSHLKILVSITGVVAFLRMDFLEELEAAFEYGNGLETPGHFFNVQRDFNEDDYEMLLTLDENNHHIGASERQINSLPQSLFQSTDSEEACVICLETPSVGDTIRHLPCLHRFHKDCIDTWLKRKRSCPICKSGIM